MDSVTVAMDASLEDPKDQLRIDYVREKLSMWLLRVNTHLMAHNQTVFKK